MLKNNKVRKILSVLAIVLVAILLLSIATTVHADETDPFTIVSGTGGSAVGKVQNWGSIILGVFQAVGMVIAVIMLVWLGVKYLMASPDGKAEIKKQAFAYILGAVLLFGASAILQMIKNVVDQESGETTSSIQIVEDIQKL